MVVRILLILSSEGTHAKYHYLICGVQGDFTKSLVNDPPRRIWTRELKVMRPPGYSHDEVTHCFYAVRWCLEHIDPLQAWYPDLHWNGSWCCAFYLHSIATLVSLFTLPQCTLVNELSQVPDLDRYDNMSRNYRQILTASPRFRSRENIRPHH